MLRAKGGSPDAVIINKAVDHAVNGNYGDARILLEQTRVQFDGIRDNNLGVLYEITGDHSKALQFYLRAYRQNRNNPYFLLNCNGF